MTSSKSLTYLFKAFALIGVEVKCRKAVWVTGTNEDIKRGNAHDRLAETCVMFCAIFDDL